MLSNNVSFRNLLKLSMTLGRQDKILGRQQIFSMGLADNSTIKKTLVNASYKLGTLMASKVVLD